MEILDEIAPCAWPSLAAAMREAGIDPAQLAALLNMSESAVGHWLAGRSNPRTARLREIAGHLSPEGGVESLLPRLLADMPDPTKYEVTERTPAWPSLAAAMKARGMSNKELGEAVGVGWWTVQNWFYGQTTPHTKRLRQIAEALADPGKAEELRLQLLADMPEESRRSQRVSTPVFSAVHSN